MNQKKKLYGKILLPTALAAALLSLTACGSGDSNNASTIASITNESSAVSTVNGEVPYTFFDDAVFVGDSVSLSNGCQKSIYHAWYERHCGLRKRRCREKHGNRIGANKRKESGHNHLCAINDANRRYCTNRLFNK